LLPCDPRPEAQIVFGVNELRSALADDFAGHPDRDRILEQFDIRRQSSLPCQYPRITDDEAAWQAAWEIRVQYGAWPGPRSDEAARSASPASAPATAVGHGVDDSDLSF